MTAYSAYMDLGSPFSFEAAGRLHQSKSDGRPERFGTTIKVAADGNVRQTIEARTTMFVS